MAKGEQALQCEPFQAAQTQAPGLAGAGDQDMQAEGARGLVLWGSGVSVEGHGLQKPASDSNWMGSDGGDETSP